MFAVDRFCLLYVIAFAGRLIKPERAPDQLVVISRRIIIPPSAGDNIDVAAAVGVGKVEKRLRMGEKVLRVGWIVCSEENLAAASAAAASPAISEPGFSVSILNAGRFIFMLRMAQND